MDYSVKNSFSGKMLFLTNFVVHKDYAFLKSYCVAPSIFSASIVIFIVHADNPQGVHTEPEIYPLLVLLSPFNVVLLVFNSVNS